MFKWFWTIFSLGALYFHSETKIEPDLRLSCCIFVDPLSHDAKRKYGLLEIEEHENKYCDINASS